MIIQRESLHWQGHVGAAGFLQSVTGAYSAQRMFPPGSFFSCKASKEKNT